MIRRMAAVALVALTGCSGFKDAFTGHQDVVARVGDHELTAEVLAQAVAGTKQVPLERAVLDRIADVWVEYQLLAQAVGRGDSLTDSATVAAANWPQIAQRLADRLHDTLIVSRAQVTDAMVDSAYNGDDARFLYHLLVAVRQDTTEAVRAAKRRLAAGYLAQIRRGGGPMLMQLAARYSDDQGTKPVGGLLGLIGRGVTVRPFEEAAFLLQPGQISEVVETAFGYHIIWRPELAQVRDSLTVAVHDAMVGRLDSLYLDSLTHQTAIRVRSSAPARVRAAAADLRSAKSGARVLATYRGGRLRERDFARWLQAFPPQIRGQIAQAPDSTLSEFVQSIARNDMLLRTAQAEGIHLLPADWDSIRANYVQELDFVEATLGIAPDSLATDSAGGDRVALAARRIDAYFAAITSPGNTRRYVEVPPFLADLLRSRTSWSISQAGIERAVDRARIIRGPEVPPAPTMAPVPNMRRAPGGPPVSETPAPPVRRIQ